MADDIEIRRRRAAWRAHHRGTKELDILVGTFAAAKLSDMTETELGRFERLLETGDPELQSWLLGPTAPASAAAAGDLADLVLSVRAFHGLS